MKAHAHLLWIMNQ